MVKKGRGHLGHGTLKLLYLKNELMNYADFFQGASDVIIFG